MNKQSRAVASRYEEPKRTVLSGLHILQAAVQQRGETARQLVFALKSQLGPPQAPEGTAPDAILLRFLTSEQEFLRDLSMGLAELLAAVASS